ncbi:MAG: beta-galactosidase trimerization domain-containing protein [Planctomycetota bacterium]|jgi:hypothetical protein
MMWAAAVAALAIIAAGLPVAGQIEIADGIVTTDDSLRGEVTTSEPLSGEGRLTLVWTDSYGRTVAEETQTVQVESGRAPFALDLSRAVAIQDFLEARLEIGDTVVSAPAREFIVTPGSAVWDDYQVIMYYPYEPSLQPRLRDLGITAGKIAGYQTRKADGAAAWYPYNYRFYCDQVSTFFYAAYHTPAYVPKNKMYAEAKEAYRKDRGSLEPFYRRPCFHDEGALADALERLRLAVRTQKPLRPIFVAHCDEAGVPDLVAPWDFCFDPRTLAAMRKWLVEQHGSLEGINRQWGTDFKNLDDVTPFTTDRMLARGDDNFSPWADHRFFMNKVFADVVRAGTDAALAEDPEIYIGLVGCQMPAAFGGYDYWLLSRAMTCIEPYNIGNNREIWRSLVPHKPAVTTAFGFGDREIWRLWYQMLHGDLGIIIYDEKFRYLNEDGGPSELGASIAPTYRELTGGIRKQLSQMERVEDPICIHYSHPSVTAHWLYEVRGSGKDWVDQESWTDRQQSDFLRLREAWVKAIEDNLFQYDFVAYGQLENGEFDGKDCRVMILPQSVAMSSQECEVLRRFVEQGGTLVADCRTALMDGHCRLLERGQLDDLFGIERADLRFAPGPPGLKPVEDHGVGWLPEAPLDNVRAAESGVTAVDGAVTCYRDANGTPAVIVKKRGKGMTVYLNAVVTDYHRWRLKPPEGDSLRGLVEAIVRAAGIARQYEIATTDGRFPRGLEVHSFRRGDMSILALHRNYQLRVHELGPPQYQSQEALEGPLEVVINVGARRAVYDQREGRFLGSTDKIEVEVPQYEPRILAILPNEVEGVEIGAPEKATAGEMLEAHLAVVGAKEVLPHALRLRVLGPDGEELPEHTRTLMAGGGKALWRVPFALSDSEGRYTLVARDLVTGAEAQHSTLLAGEGAECGEE